jgi:malate dehydrogenase
VIAARKLSSAMSAAKAIADHLRDWLAVRRALHTEDDDWASMAVYSTGAGYDPSDVPEDVFFSLPVRCSRDGSWTAVKGIEPWDRELLQRTAMELVAERDEALGFLKSEEGKPGQETLSPLPSCLLNRLVGSMPASKL